MISIPDASFVNTLWAILILSWILISIFWLLVMQRALELVAPFNKMNPANVWLTFIPAFGLYWQFIVVQRVADSLGDEYIRRGIIPREPRPGKSVGLTANILLCCAFIPSFGILVGLVSNISRLMHLFKIKNYTEELEGIIRTQMQYPQAPQEPNYFQEVNPALEEELKKNNPNRFMPPESAEEIEKRWRRK